MIGAGTTCVSCVAAKSGAESGCLVAPGQQPEVGRVFVRNPSLNQALVCPERH
jgi:hypothetical protein